MSLDPVPVYAWVALGALLLAALVGLLVWWSAAPRELAGADARTGEAVTLTVLAAPGGDLALWVRYELATDDEFAEVRVAWEATSGGRRVGGGTATRDGARVWHGGRLDWESFSDRVAVIRGAAAGERVEVRVTVGECTVPARVLKARAYVAR